MEKEENILQLILEKENWEEIIYHIVSIEKLDPWNIDLIKLTDSFINYLKKIEELDFRIPARVVFVAAVLLKLKADYLSIFEEEGETIEQIAQQKPIDLGIDPNLIQLGIPIKRIPKRQITLDELILALRKAISVRERRIEKKMRLRERIVLEIGEEDISKRIEEMMKEIEEMMNKLKSEKIGFSQIVGEWKREKVVKKFIPLLHLDNNGKIDAEQEDFFQEIWIKKRNF